MVLSISDRRKVICGRGQSELFGEKKFAAGARNFFSYACSGQRQFSTVSFIGFGLWVRVRVVITIIISLTLTLTLIRTLTVILS